MANLPKWDQPIKGHQAQGGTRAASKKQMPFGTDEPISPFGQSSPFDAVAATQAQSGSGSSISGMNGASGASMQQAFQAPFVMKPGSVTGMGPYVAGAPSGATTTGSAWSGGPLGAVPNHHGWAGLKQNTKDWTLRILGAFPGLRFSSGYRSPAQNAAANGAANSGHMRGDKIDLSGNTKLMYEAAAWAKRYGARTLLHDAGSGFHLDISWAGVNS